MRGVELCTCHKCSVLWVNAAEKVIAMATTSYNFETKPKLPIICYKRYDCLSEEYKLLKTPLLMSAKEKGCLKGWHYFAKINEPSEDVWATIQFLSAVVLFSFSAGFLIRGQKAGYDYARFTISMGFLIYATVDAITRMAFRLASYCAYVNSEDYVNPEAADSDTTEELTKTGPSGATQDGYPEKLEVTNIDEDTTPTTQNELEKDNTLTVMASRENVRLDYKSRCRGKCLNFLSKFRFIIIDFFLYPLFICNLPKYAGSGGLDDLDFNYRKYEGAYILVFCGIYILLVYLSRILVLSFSLRSILLQLILTEEEETSWKTICKACCCKSCTLPGLLIHTLCQFIFQAMMLIILWVIASSEFNSPASQGSGIFWVLVCLGYLCPVFGILSFFITDCYNSEDLLVTLMERSAEIQNSDYHQELIKQHSEVSKEPIMCFYRVFYSFFSFPLICMAITYSIFLSVFVIICIAVFFSAESAVGWEIFLIFFVVWISVINLRVLFTGCGVMLACAIVVAAVVSAVAFTSAVLLAGALIIFLFFVLINSCSSNINSNR